MFLIERQGGDIIIIIVVGTLCYSGCSNAVNGCGNAAVLCGIRRVAQRIGEYIELPNHIRAVSILVKGGGADFDDLTLRMVRQIRCQLHADVSRPADFRRFRAVFVRVGAVECVANRGILVGGHGNVDILIGSIRYAGLCREGRGEHGGFAFADRRGAQCRDGGMTDGIRPDSSAGNGVYVVVIVIRYGLHVQYIFQRLAAQLGGHTVGFHYTVTGPERMVGIIVNAALGAVVLHTGDLAVGSCYADTDLIRAAGHTAVRYCTDVGARAGGQTGDRDKLHGLFGDIGSLAVLDGDGLDGNGAVCAAVRLNGQRCAFKGFCSVPVYTRSSAVGGIPDDTAIPGRNMKFRRGCCCIQQLCPSVCRFQGWRRGRLLAFLVVGEGIDNGTTNRIRRIGCTGNAIERFDFRIGGIHSRNLVLRLIKEFGEHSSCAVPERRVGAGISAIVLHIGDFTGRRIISNNDLCGIIEIVY